ncbi:MAG: hypothetical protein Q4B77_06145 [Coriobacteriaceae bacterium]|nr:hypothetical protein [Coriobacteriaceae bacterium]
MKRTLKNLRGSSKLRIRRGALPSSLMGLVTFSFTLLVFTTVAYTSSLPSLVMARARVNEEGLFPAITQALFGKGGTPGVTGEQGGDSAGAEGGANASNSKNNAGGRPGFSLGGAVLQGLGKPTGGAQGDKPGKPGKPGSGDSDDGSGKPDSGDGDINVPGGGDPDAPEIGGGGDGGDSGQNPQEPTPSPEEEQEHYEFLLGKAQRVDGYIAEVNACVTAFNQDSLADLQTRRNHLGTCNALSYRLFDDYATTMNAVIPNGSAYIGARGKLTAMFRCLLEYLGTIQEAWEIKVNFDDHAAHIEEFMFPVYRDTVNGQNVHLTEFYTYYNGFEL